MSEVDRCISFECQDRTARIQQQLTASHAEVLSLKSANEDLRLDNADMQHEREAKDKQLYEQVKVRAEAEKRATEAEWVSVDDRLPISFVPVLICVGILKVNVILVGCYDALGGVWWNGFGGHYVNLRDAKETVLFWRESSHLMPPTAPGAQPLTSERRGE